MENSEGLGKAPNSTPPEIPEEGLSEGQLLYFVNNATQKHWDAFQAEAAGNLQDFHTTEALLAAFAKFRTEYETGRIQPNKETGQIGGTYIEPLPWLQYDRLAPVATFYHEEPLAKLAARVKKYSFEFSKAQFLWNVSRGVVGYVDPGSQGPRYELLESDFPIPDEEFRTLRALSGTLLSAHYRLFAKKQYLLPIIFKITNPKTGTLFEGTATAAIEFELRKYSATRTSALGCFLDIQFGKNSSPWDINAAGFLDAAAKAIRGMLPTLPMPDLDWYGILADTLKAEPGPEPDPGQGVQESLPLDTPATSTLARFISLATFAFPSDTQSRLLNQAFGVYPSKEHRELSRIGSKPESERTEEERRRFEEIKDAITIHRQDNYNDEYKLSSVTLQHRVRETNSIEAKAIITIRAEAPADGGEITPSHLEAAIDTYFADSAATFYGPGRRHLALIMKELYCNNWTYRFEATEHIRKMRTLKPGESPSREEKERARKIVTWLCDSLIDVRSKKGARHGTDARKYFSIDRIEGFLQDKGEVLTIRATEELKALFQSSAGTALQYIPILESIIREDHQVHGIATMLNLHLSQLWRMNPIQKMRVKDIFDLVGKDPSPANENRMRDLKKLESELDYMAAQSPPYLGRWEGNGDAPKPSKCRTADPFDCVLTLAAPDWLREGVEQIKTRRASFLPKPPEQNQGMTREGLEDVIRASGLSANKFAAAIGYSKGLLSETRSGKREITPALEAKIRARFASLLAPEPPA